MKNPLKEGKFVDFSLGWNVVLALWRSTVGLIPPKETP